VPTSLLRLSIQGYLMKRRETGNWQRRWCVLTERDMEYYHSRQVGFWFWRLFQAWPLFAGWGGIGSKRQVAHRARAHAHSSCGGLLRL